MSKFLRDFSPQIAVAQTWGHNRPYQDQELLTRRLGESPLSISSPSPQFTNDHLGFRQEINCFFLLAISSYMLLWVAVFNGYPVFFPDSGQYLWISFDLQPPIYRK